jgi:xylulokinase
VNWPELADPFAPVATWPLGGRRVPVFAPLGDHQAALAGSGLGEGELSINVSTGSQVSRLARERAGGAAQTRAYFDGWLLQTVTHLPAGRSLEVLVDLLTELPRRCGLPEFDPWPTIVAAAREAPDDDLEVDLTFFAGPLGDRGAIRHISLDNLQVGRIFRAAWRGMAKNYHECARWLSPAGDWRQLVFSGGLAHKLELLRQYACERFGSPSRTCVATEDTLQGLLAVAMVLTGEAPGVVAAGRKLESGDVK